MHESIIQTEDVWKSFGRTAAVRGLSLRVPRGSVYGFLGPNGAGKSTTIRMMLGLQRADRGRILLFGTALRAEREKLLARIGSLVEAPSLYLHLTGRENLEVHRRLLDAPRRAIQEALNTVGLAAAGDRVVRGYSSGMKQRLGIAQALLGSPELLVLDEPTNGLDPAGMHEVRALIRELPGRSGATIFLSSHLLAEVEQVATHFAIVARGEAKFEGTAEELRLRSRPALAIGVGDCTRAQEVLAQAGIASALREGRLRVAHDETAPEKINALLVRAGIGVSHLAVEYPALEDVFLEMTGAAHDV